MTPPCLPALAGPAAALGALYVIEGSGLRGRVIARHLSNSLGVSAGAGGSFYCRLDAETARHRWHCLVALVESADMDADAMVAGASAIFGCLEQWLRTLKPFLEQQGCRRGGSGGTVTYWEHQRKDDNIPDTTVAGADSLGPDNPYVKLRAPGKIQGFGAFLTLHPSTLRVLSASENVGSELGVPHATILGRPLFELISGDEAIAHIKECMATDSPTFENPLCVTVGGRRFDLIMHSHDGVVFAEFEKLAPGAPTRADMDRLSDSAIMGMMVPEMLDELLQAGPEAIRTATDFDRVLLYRFDDAYRGQAVGEARRPGVESFVGLFFPESDIGAPARQIHTENFCRYIPQIGAMTSRVLPAENPLTTKPLDMLPAVLRAVAPCHIAYLSNMGVTASMSFSIVSEGRLWGLFACHHYSQSQLSYTQRLICEQIAMMFVAKFSELVNPAAMAEEMQDRRDALLRSSPLCKGNPLQQEWTADAERALLTLVNAEGATIYVDGQVGKIGVCPDLGELHAFIEKKPDEFDRLLRMYDEEGLFYTSSIASVLPFGAEMREKGSGVMVVPMGRGRQEFLMWFRPELVVKATWAGNPSDTKVKDINARFSPRQSFAAWKQDIRDRPEPWSHLDIANAVALRDQVMALVG